MADEVNQAAFDGGDTAPGTKEQIKERNEAMQTLVDKHAEIGQTLQQAQLDANEAALEAEAAVAESTNALITGQPVTNPPEVNPENTQQKAPAATTSPKQSSSS